MLYILWRGVLVEEKFIQHWWDDPPRHVGRDLEIGEEGDSCLSARELKLPSIHDILYAPVPEDEH